MSHKMETAELEATDLDLIRLSLTHIMGIQPDMIRVGNKLRVKGYAGATYSQNADLVIRKEGAGCRYGEIGFEKTASGRYKIVGDDLDVRRLDFENKFKQAYFEGTIRRQMADALAQGQQSEVVKREVQGTTIHMRIEVPA